MLEKPILAIIVPCFNEEEVIKTTYFALFDILKELISGGQISPESYICFVDDGSIDKTWEKIIKLSKYKDARGLKLSRNFGHQSALMAGLTQNEADIFISVDADLQDDVNAIKEMVTKYHEGFEIVYGVRNKRDSDGFWKRNLAQLYYKFAKSMGVSGIYNHADYRLMSKKVVEILKNSKECNLYLRGLIPSLGFKSDCVYYARQKRAAGEAKYNCFSSLKLALNGITSFSITPLHVITGLGAFCFFVAIIMTTHSALMYFQNKIVPGWTSLIISIYFLGGIQLLSIGVLGEYIGKIYKETKHRPTFIIEEKTTQE